MAENPDDVGGEEPDTIDGRLAGIARLIDTFSDEVNQERRRKRRAAIIRLLADVQLDVGARVQELRDRLGP